MLGTVETPDSAYKLITAIVRPNKVDDVKDALAPLGQVGMTITEVRGHGKQKGHTAIYRGQEYNVSLLPKMQIEVVVPTELSDKVNEAIIKAARTGEIGDGRVFVKSVYGYTTIRTGELSPTSMPDVLHDSQHRLYTAIVRPNKVDDVKDAFGKLNYNGGMTVTEVRGHGKQKGHTAIYRDKEYNVSLLPKMKIETIVPWAMGDEVSRAIIQAARTGEVGDGKVWWAPVEQSFRIQTGDKVA